LIVRQGVMTAALGVALGIAASVAATRGLGALLYETPANDPTTMAATGTLLLVVATLAAYLPARRTLRRNPAELLRAE
jgi:ABC-type antimicrobial peptide transport system permease subunit